MRSPRSNLTHALESTCLQLPNHIHTSYNLLSLSEIWSEKRRNVLAKNCQPEPKKSKQRRSSRWSTLQETAAIWEIDCNNRVFCWRVWATKTFRICRPLGIYTWTCILSITKKRRIPRWMMYMFVFDRTQIETPILMWSLLFVSLQEMTGSKETFLHTLGLQLSVHQGASESHFTHHGECLFRHYVVFFMKWSPFGTVLWFQTFTWHSCWRWNKKEVCLRGNTWYR